MGTKGKDKVEAVSVEEDGNFEDLSDALSDSDVPEEALPSPAPASSKAAPLAVPAEPPKSAPLTLGEGSTEDRVSHLSRVNMFAGLTPMYLRRIAALCDEEVHPEGAYLFKEGETGDKLYIIVQGAVRISRNISGMGEEALAVLRSGDYFGEMALIEPFPRSADACAHEPCRVLVMDKQKLEDLLFVDRDLAYDLLWNFVRTLSGRLRQTNDKMTFLAVTNKF